MQQPLHRIHPELALVAQVRQEDSAIRLMRAIGESNRIREERMKVIEAPKVEAFKIEDAVELPDHSK